MKKFAERLKELRQRDNLTQQELAEKIGISKSSINMYERGEREPGFVTMEAIADIFNVDMNSLYGRDVYDYLGRSTLTPTAQRIGRAYEKATPPVKRTVEVALEPYMEDRPDNVIDINFGQSEQPASAGTGAWLEPERMITRKVRADALPKDYPRNPDRYFGVPVAGDSMEPRYRDGDVLIVSKEPVNVGEIGVFTMDGAGYVKELGPGVLHSLNPEYKDIPLTGDIICNGKVVGVLTPEDYGE